MEHLYFRAMNSDITIIAEGSHAREGIELAQAYIQSSEKRFTRFSEESELSHLNRSAGEWCQVSADMFTLIETALVYYKRTDGLFDPTILRDLQSAGYNKSMDEIRASGADLLLAPVSKSNKPRFDSLEMNRDRSAIRLPKEMQLDLGGIAKGWIAEQAARLLSEHSTACAVNAGGDIFFIGHPQGQDRWEVSLEDPRAPSQFITMLLVDEGAVATSSVAKRVWKQGELNRHHLIDPRTGQPSEIYWLSVTVFAPHAAAAETFAKAILIGGPQVAERLIKHNPEISYLAVDQQGQLWDGSKESLNVHSEF
ncbi:MAG: FAD:protein FMN transferase [Anaerolineales bacterium]